MSVTLFSPARYAALRDSLVLYAGVSHRFRADLVDALAPDRDASAVGMDALCQRCEDFAAALCDGNRAVFAHRYDEDPPTEPLPEDGELLRPIKVIRFLDAIAYNVQPGAPSVPGWTADADRARSRITTVAGAVASYRNQPQQQSSSSMPNTSTGDLTFYRDTSTPGNVIAAGSATRSDGLREGYTATYDRPNSPVSWNAFTPSSLGNRLTEDEARELHPRLFDELDE